MAKKIDWSDWKEISNPPKWVKRAASKWYHTQNVRPYGGVKHFVGRHFVYRIWFERTGHSQTQWHFYRKPKSKNPKQKTINYHFNVRRYTPFIAILIGLAVIGGLIASSPSTIYSISNNASEGLNLIVSNYSHSNTELLEKGVVTETYSYTLRGKKVVIPYTMYGGVSDHLSSDIPYFYGNYQDYYFDYLDEDIQKDYLSGLTQQIRSKASDPDDQARIAISLVQNIPYDFHKYYNFSKTMRYPYQVIYDNKGICAEKSLLTAFLLRELGYGVALFEFHSEDHMAVGIKVPMQYAYKGTGYAFVESTAPTIITDSEGNYIGVGQLVSNPSIITISDGRSFDSVSEEFKDARDWQNIISLGSQLDQYHYALWQNLVNKYGLKIDGQ